ncbi:MAG: hypothetical protein JWR42_748 [Marmoricola sp.]|nr:hypothetical protein [Marmoricola sp.]
MRAAYKALSHSIAGLVAVQAALIGLATAGLLHWVEDGHTLTPSAVKAENTGATGEIGFALHSGIGMILIPLLTIALVVVAFLLKEKAARTWAIALLVVVVVQVGLGSAAGAVPFLGLVHGLLALVVAWLGWHAATVVGREPAAVRV